MKFKKLFKKTFTILAILSIVSCVDTSSFDPLMDGNIVIAPLEDKEFALPLFTGELAITDLINEEDVEFLNSEKSPWEFNYTSDTFNVLSATEFANIFQNRTGVNIFQFDIDLQFPFDPNLPVNENTYPRGTFEQDLLANLAANEFIQPDTIALESGSLDVVLRSKESQNVNFEVSLYQIDAQNDEMLLTTNSINANSLNQIVTASLPLTGVTFDFSQYTYQIRISSTFQSTGSDAFFYLLSVRTESAEADFVAFTVLKEPDESLVTTLDEGNVEINLFDETFDEGIVVFDSMYLASMIDNSTGFSARTVFTELYANTRDNGRVDLQLTNNAIDIPAGSTNDIKQSTIEFENAVDLVNQLPKEVIYNGYIEVVVNVNDRISVSRSSQITSNIVAALPLTLGFKDIDFSTSASLGFESDDNIGDIEEATLSIEIQNSLPIFGRLQLGLSDLENDPNPYIIDLNGDEEGDDIYFLKPTSDTEMGLVSTQVVLSEDDVKRILGSNYIFFLGSFNTPLDTNGDPQVVDIAPDEDIEVLTGLKLKMSYDPESDN